ncbi:MAG: hypothetical protein ABEJ95_04430 [Candidatus Nanohalobium sp.]
MAEENVNVEELKPQEKSMVRMCEEVADMEPEEAMEDPLSCKAEISREYQKAWE